MFWESKAVITSCDGSGGSCSLGVCGVTDFRGHCITEYPEDRRVQLLALHPTAPSLPRVPESVVPAQLALEFSAPLPLPSGPGGRWWRGRRLSPPRWPCGAGGCSRPEGLCLCLLTVRRSRHYLAIGNADMEHFPQQPCSGFAVAVGFPASLLGAGSRGGQSSPLALRGRSWGEAEEGVGTDRQQCLEALENGVEEREELS